MTDLSGIARHLRLPVEQLRIAADLLEQGYHPAFIERYRADETGRLSHEVLWSLRRSLDRQGRLREAQQKALKQLPKDAQLDGEAERYLQRANSEVDIDVALRAFRARRALQQSQEQDSRAGQVLELLIGYEGQPPEDLEGWLSEQLGLDRPTAHQALSQAGRLLSNLIQCDTSVLEKLRKAVQKKAEIRVEFCDTSGDDQDDSSRSGAPSPQPTASQPPATHIENGTDQSQSKDQTQPGEVEASTDHSTTAELAADDQAAPSPPSTETSQAADEPPAQQLPGSPSRDFPAASQAAREPMTSSGEAPAPEPTATDAPVSTSETTAAESSASGSSAEKSGNDTAKKDTAKKDTAKKKASGKLTPRQRRRRWLISMLQSMKSLKRPLSTLTAYQHLMLGRGRRSQLIKVNLKYDSRLLVPMARDAFISDRHPLVNWFDSAVQQSLEHVVRAKIEVDAITDLEEHAQEKLLESSTEQLRYTLLRRPVRGHTVMLIDTVGPKTSSVAVVDPYGKVLATYEIACSAQPEVVSQNVVKLGEWAHKHRVTLVAMTNGPARRFLVLTLRELMRQSAESGLRWTMADRGGAEAYAAGRIGLKELSEHNRRDRAAIWIARSLQDPLRELLKVDINRLRLGSYQRELPQEPLKQLVRDTITDCICYRGLDVYHAAPSDLAFVPGVGESQATQIAEAARQGRFRTRQELIEQVSDWEEQQRRQAIGWLRVYASPQPLDGTLIHPDDYRLAERLIANTELTEPPVAPPDWSKPQASADDVSRQAAGAEPTGEPSAATSKPASDETTSDVSEQERQTVVAESAAADAETLPADAAGDTSDEPQAASEAAKLDAEATSQASADVSGGTGANDSAADAASNPSQPPDENATTSDTGSAVAAEDATSEDSTSGDVAVGFQRPPKQASQPEAGPAETAVKPEYPEDIHQQPSTPPSLDVEKLARGWQVGREKLRRIAEALHDPFGDLRLSRTPVPLSKDMPRLDSLEPGMCVWAVVVGVADFGAFVELSPDCSGLIHISRLSTEFVEDPHQCVQVGDLLLTWVISVDQKKNRVALTALSPEQRAIAEEAARQRRQGEPGRGRGGQAGQARRSGPSAKTEHGGQGSGSSARGSQGRGGAGRGARRGDSRGGRDRGGKRPAKSLEVNSKKPKSDISQAMKQGEEPLRSFSDLLQFYEAKRSDEVPPKPTTRQASEPTNPPQDSQASAGKSEAELAASSQATSPSEQDSVPENADIDQAAVDQSTSGEHEAAAANESRSDQVSGTPAAGEAEAAAEQPISDNQHSQSDELERTQQGNHNSSN